jgi:hypothetical protein
LVDSSLLAMAIGRVSGWLLGVTVEKFTFKLIEIRDEAGLLIRLRISFQDLAEVQQLAADDPAFQKIVESGLLRDRLPVYLTKCITTGHPAHMSSMWRAVLLVQVCAWKVKKDGTEVAASVLFLERRPWIKAVCRYASGYGVSVIPVSPPLKILAAIRRRLPPKVVGILRDVRYRSSWGRIRAMTGPFFSATGGTPNNGLSSVSNQARSTARDLKPKVAVEFYGQLNLDHPEHHSDLFFWQTSPLLAEDILLTFRLARFPVDERRWAQLQKHGISAVALHPGGTAVPAVPVFNPPRGRARRPKGNLDGGPRGMEGSWLREHLAKYQELRAYWADLATAHAIKVFVTWFKYDAVHCAIADGLQDAGGVTAIYQRGFECQPSAETTIAADIVFGFSQATSDVERRSNSIIPYHVTTGYLGDHRVALLRAGAQVVRRGLKEFGANRILAFTDENSLDDSRWHVGHAFMRENYSFLLEKVLAEPWLGLVLKPKAPGTLRRRLGPVAGTLKAAEATGRCYVYEGGVVQGLHPPAEAALASDIAIHGHLCAATAGLEAALAGVPTLLLDREGWSASPLYRLGPGQVIFTDWQTLWEACQAHWSTSRGIPGLGDWSPMLDELDPFRDGRAGERMGTYLKWLIEGFRAGLDREAVMAEAAERYCSVWGIDKITSVNCGKARHPAPFITKDENGRHALLSTDGFSPGVKTPCL